MMLGELITALEAEDPAKVCPDGFGRPHSWRGDYFDLAFDPAQNVTVGSMLAAARSAVGATYQGWKGGDYTMDLDSDCYLAEPRDLGETLGPTLLRLMLAAGSVPAPAAELTEAHKLAEQIILSHTEDIEYGSIGEMLDDEYERLGQEAGDRLRDEVDKLITEATVTVTWAQGGEQAEAGQ